MKKLLACGILVCAVAAALPAQRPQAGTYLDQNVQACWDPLGLQLVTKLFYRAPLIQRDGLLWESTRIDVGFLNSLSASYEMAGVFLTVEPIAVFNVTVSAQVAGFYDVLGFGFYSLSGYAAGFDSSSLQALSPKNTAGFVLSAAPTVKVALGPFALLDTFTVMYFNVDGGQGYFYERINNCVLGKSDTELVNQASVMYVLQPGTLVGITDWILSVPSSGYLSHKVNVMGIFSAGLSKGLSLYGALAVGTYLADRYYQNGIYLGGQVGVVVRL